MQQDHLSRKPFIDLLKNIIANQAATKTGYSIAIDGEWGSGKTWVLTELEQQLSQVENNKYLIFHYNAWENDFYEEPLIAILSVMIGKINEITKQKSIYESTVDELLKETGKDLKLLLCGITKEITKIDIEKSINSKKGLIKRIKKGTEIPNDINSMLPMQNALNTVQKNITKLAEKLSIILVVDELDRCLPEYAIKVLERLHHVCNEMPVFQIIAINKKDLAFGIAKVFGMNNPNIDIEKFADKYLQKFIQLTIPLNNGQISTEEDILSGIDEGFTPAIAIDKNYLIQFYQQLMNGIPPRTQEYIKQQVTLIHKLTVLSGHTLEYYSYGLLCCELMYCIMKFIFKREPSYKLEIENNQLLVKSGLFISSDKNLIFSCSQFDSNLDKLFRTSTDYYSDGRVNSVTAVPCNNGQCQMLNYFVENYYIRDKWPDVLRSDAVFIPEREFLEFFKETLKNF